MSLASHVPSKTRQAILRGEYVEFDSLLPENLWLDGDHRGVSISFDEKQLNIPSHARKKKTHIDSIDKWLSAFAIYCTILLVNFPQRAVEMLSYQEIIRSAQRKFTGFAWLSYDIDFRRKAASNLALNWGARDIQLYLMKLTGQAKSSCTICGSGNHFAYGCSLSDLRPNSAQRGTCNNFNHGFKWPSLQNLQWKSYMERLKSLHLLTLKSRRTLLDLTFLYKCLNGLLNINLSRFINSRDTAAYDLRNADLSFKIQYTRTNMLKYSYFHRTVKAWNYLPVHVRKSESLSEFKRLCKAYFYQLDTKLT